MQVALIFRLEGSCWFGNYANYTSCLEENLGGSENKEKGG